LYELHRRPALDHPVLIVGMEGWIDAGLGAATAMAALLAAVTTEQVATFDVDTLLDHRARRPVVRIVDGVNTGLRWPEIELRGGHDGAGHDLLVLTGPEPDHQWRAFTATVCDLAAGFGVTLVIGLGAFPAPVPHTRPARLASTATSAELAQRVGYLPGALDVPAGVQAALERAFAERGVPAVGLWARVPHYAAAMPYPEASAVLLEGLASVSGITIDTAELRRAAETSRQHLDKLIANSEDHIALVRQLETQVDADVPSGDEIAAELERFLRGEGG
jgi:proteasome assembly chaperone (PAC2) family protein